MEIKSIKMASSIEDEARTLAKRMSETGEKLLPLSFGDGNAMFVASDSNLIRAIDVAEVDGVMYFIGFKK